MIEKPMLANRIKKEDLNKLVGYAIEPKQDGSRNLFIIDLLNDSLVIKRRNSQTNLFEIVPNYQFPEFNIKKLKKIFNNAIRNIILDGEMISKDFPSLLSRTHLMNPLKCKLASKTIPVKYIVFDILYLNNNDLTHLPYIERRHILETELIKKNNLIKIIDVFVGNPLKIFEDLINKGFEGIVAKRIDSPYIQKRSNYWLKCKKEFTETLEIIGYDTKSKSRPQKNKSVNVRVLNLITKLGRISVPNQKDIDYFYKHKPQYVEVSFQELSKNNKMRFPKFVRFI